MKKINLCFLVLGLFISTQSMTATNPISVESYEEVIKKTDSNKGFFTKTKVWFKKAADKMKIQKMANAALIFGIIAFTGMILAFTVIGSGIVFLLLATMALVADILAIVVLMRTGKEKDEHRKARKKAIWGLVLALLAGLTPLAFFFLILALL